MPNAYPREFQARAVELVRASGRAMGQIGCELGVSATGPQHWGSQAKVDGCERSGIITDDRS